MKRLGVFLIPLDEMLVHRRSLPQFVRFSQQFTGAHLYSWMRCTYRVSPRTQCNVPGQGSHPDRSVQRRAHQSRGYCALLSLQSAFCTDRLGKHVIIPIRFSTHAPFHAFFFPQFQSVSALLNKNELVICRHSQ